MQKFITSHKNYLVFVAIVVGIAFLIGIIYYQLLDQNLKNSLNLTISNLNNFKFNNILKDLIIMSLLLVCSFFIIGLPLSIFYIFYESFSLGFLFNVFYSVFKIKGIIYFLLYFIIFKLLIFILIIFFIKKIINISRYIIGYIVYRRDSKIKEKIFMNFKKSLYSILIILLINVILSFLYPVLSENLSFLLK